ncbi:hypothetical protein PG996_004866 [Apiospora saccharicola]|uniref:Carboxylic ester hydrolase n=1 Tax=Apiospora saccharicola TaxID=335842 RepID=A0ABR1VJU3_9PEZI
MAQAEPRSLLNGGHEPLDPSYPNPTALESPTPSPPPLDTDHQEETQHREHLQHREDTQDQEDHRDTVSSTATQQSYQTIAQNDPSNSKHLQPPPPSVWKQWWVEVVGCVLMVAMLATMVGILSPNNGKPLPDWPFHISINAVISTLSTVLKACAAFILAEGTSHSKWKWFQNNRSLHDIVVFDNASRGPWGCLSLLLAPRGLHPIASLGAALAVLTLALDPFTQQLIHYYDCRQVIASSNATLPRSTSYCQKYQNVPFPTIGLINQGLFNPADVKTPFVCPSGNCTFDHLSSPLGFCSTCEDMSSQLKFINISSGNPPGAEFQYFVNTTLPSGSYTSIGQYEIDETSFAMNSTDDGWIEIIQVSKAYPGGTPNWWDDHYYANYVRGLTKDMNMTGCTTAKENNTWACSGFGGSGAARCRLDPCVKTYSANVEHGRLQENLVHAQLDMFIAEGRMGETPHTYDEDPRPDRDSYWLAADLKCAGPEVVSRLQEAGFRIRDDDIIIPWSVMANKSDGKATVWRGESESSSRSAKVPGPLLNETGLPLDVIPGECLYSLCQNARAIIRHYLETYFHGAIHYLHGYDDEGQPQLLAMYNNTYASFDSISQAFTSIAEGITQHVRRYVEPDALPVAQPALGVVFEQKTCVSVRWPYIAFPAAVVALTTVFLLAIVGQAALGTTGMAAPGWKSSPLPMMFRGLTTDANGRAPGNLDGGAGLTPSLPEMERVAKTTTARLNI